MENFRHLGWLWLLCSLGIRRWSLHRLESWLWLGVEEPDSTLEDLAWKLEMNLPLVNWLLDRRAKLLWLGNPVSDDFWRVYQVH